MDPRAELDLTEMSEVMKRRLPVFLLIFAIIMVLDLLVTFFTPPLYRATAKMVIQNEGNLYPAEILPSTSTDSTFLNTQKEIISSKSIVAGALSDVRSQGMLKSTDYEDLKNNVSAKYLSDSSIMEVDVDLGDQKEAVALANAIVGSFLKYQATDKTALIDKGLDTVNAQLALLKSAKDEMRSSLGEFKDKEQLNYYEAQIPHYISNILELNKRNLSVQNDITRMKEELVKTSSAIKSGNMREMYPLLPAIGITGESPTSSLTNIPWMDDMKKKISDAQATLSRSSVEFTENNPETAGLRNQISALQSNLDSELQRVFSAYVDYYRGYIQFLETQQKSNDTEKARNESQLSALSKNIDTASARQIEYNMLLKNYDAMQDIYAIFIRKQNQLRALREEFTSSTLPNMRIFENAAIPLKQVSPNIPLNIALGLFIGIFLGIAGSFTEEKREYRTGRGRLASAKASQQDRRSMSRITRTFAVAFTSRPGQSRLYGSTENISGSGIELITKERLHEDQQMLIEIHVSDKDFISATAKVVWVKPAAKDSITAGLHFVKIEPQEREKLINYLYGEHYLAVGS